jgi:hypothetical protein
VKVRGDERGGDQAGEHIDPRKSPSIGRHANQYDEHNGENTKTDGLWIEGGVGQRFPSAKQNNLVHATTQGGIDDVSDLAHGDEGSGSGHPALSLLYLQRKVQRLFSGRGGTPCLGGSRF